MYKLIAIVAMLISPAASLAAAGDDLPDIGSPADVVLTESRESQLGRMVLRQIREADVLVEDPAVDEYIQDLGHRLATHAHEGEHKFYFFVVDDPSINAFALPGGYIGVHAGLIEATKTESELAGVLAHEIAHVTQRHIARAIFDSQRTSMASAAAMLAGILLGAATGAGGDVMQGVVMASQAAAIQQQINFTRSNEYEADRVGMGVLAAAGYNPQGMPAFFETMQRRYGLASKRIPQLLQTHPVTTARIAESRGRARLLPRQDPEDSTNYGLVRARLELLSARNVEDAQIDFERRLKQDPESVSARFGLALTFLKMSLPDRAELILRKLLKQHPDTIAFHVAHADALLAGGNLAGALDAYQHAIDLFPRNVPVTVAYGEALISAGQAREAHQLLLDLLNNIPPTPTQIRLIARAANAEGDIGNAHFYMAEYHLMLGNLRMALEQLRMAQESPGVDSVDSARYAARMQDLRDLIPEKQRKNFEEPSPEKPESGG
jgi:predicted Zn-dependent protease